MPTPRNFRDWVLAVATYTHASGRRRVLLGGQLAHKAGRSLYVCTGAYMLNFVPKIFKSLFCVCRGVLT